MSGMEPYAHWRSQARPAQTFSRMYRRSPKSGLPGYESVQTFGILAPKGTPRPVIDKLNAALREALALNEVKMKLAVDGTEPLPGTPEDYAAAIDREETKWSKLIKQIGVKAE